MFLKFSDIDNEVFLFLRHYKIIKTPVKRSNIVYILISILSYFKILIFYF